ncbi:MAG TPA: GNAT family N-acetyltransferase [Streptosporangiaceae bacterium]|jgi:GNAT superfamily N-acetyltransferase
MFCDIGLAARIERAEAEFMAACTTAALRRTPQSGGFVMPIAGGVATYAEPGSPLNKVAGLGFAGVPDKENLDEIERAHAERGLPVQVELAHLVDPAVLAALIDRGYRLTSYENVSGRALPGRPWPPPPANIEVSVSGPEEFDAWLDVVIDAVAHADTEGLPAHEEFPAQVIAGAMTDFARAGVRRYAALLEGNLAGGASLRLADGIAQFGGAATAPPYRRRGVQSALLATRLADAATAGCDIAVVTTQPASKSQQNVQRWGFDLLYTRAILVKDPIA